MGTFFSSAQSSRRTAPALALLTSLAVATASLQPLPLFALPAAAGEETITMNMRDADIRSLILMHTRAGYPSGGMGAAR